MTYLDVNSANISRSTFWQVVKGFFAADARTPKKKGGEADHASELLDMVENGFIVEETGERAELPQFARTHLKTMIKLKGCE